MKRKQLYAVTVIVTMLLSFVSGTTPSFAAQVGCLPDVKKRAPLLFVHGLGANAGIWSKDKPSMAELVAGNKELYSDKPFDYSAKGIAWVDNPAIGPELAKEIACRAVSSRTAGGYGKVVVIAHSMGGLAAQYAANQKVDNRAVADDLGLVIKIATPHEGSMVASSVMAVVRDICNFQVAFGRPINQQLCREYVEGLGAVGALQAGSDKLRQLPKMPSSVPVLTIAGHVKEAKLNFFNVEIKPTNSDLMVGVKSATVGAAQKAMGGGAVVVDCIGVIAIPMISDASCEHGRLLNDKQVQARVSDGLRQYLLALAKPPVPTSVAPSVPPAAPACASAGVFTQVMKKKTQGQVPSADYSVKKGPVCQDGKAAAILNGVSGDLLTVLGLQSGQWQYELAGDYMPVGTCARLPAKLRELFQSVQGCVG